jgi:hypothetical protein
MRNWLDLEATCPVQKTVSLCEIHASVISRETVAASLYPECFYLIFKRLEHMTETCGKYVDLSKFFLAIVHSSLQNFICSEEPLIRARLDA